MLCRSFSTPQHIPSWTGFRIAISNREPVKDASIGYLDCIDSPATDISTVYHILERCLRIKDALNLQTVVCVFDQAIYYKVMEIKWKQPERFQSCIVMLDIFHTIMMFLWIIGNESVMLGCEIYSSKVEFLRRDQLIERCLASSITDQ